MHLSYRRQTLPSTQPATRSKLSGFELGLLKYRGISYSKMAASHQPSGEATMKLTYRGQSYVTSQPIVRSNQSTAPVVLSYRGALYTQMV